MAVLKFHSVAAKIHSEMIESHQKFVHFFTKRDFVEMNWFENLINKTFSSCSKFCQGNNFHED